MKFISSCIVATLIFSPPVRAEDMGRLFFSPQQRNQLDYTFARNATPDGESSPVLTVNGIVQRNGGARTVWVNGVPQTTRNQKGRNPTTASVSVPGKSGNMNLKVGDKILIDQSPAAAQK